MRLRGLRRRLPSDLEKSPPRRGILSRLGIKKLYPGGSNIAHRELYFPGRNRPRRRIGRLEGGELVWQRRREKVF